MLRLVLKESVLYLFQFYFLFGELKTDKLAFFFTNYYQYFENNRFDRTKSKTNSVLSFSHTRLSRVILLFSLPSSRCAEQYISSCLCPRYLVTWGMHPPHAKGIVPLGSMVIRINKKIHSMHVRARARERERERNDKKMDL